MLSVALLALGCTSVKVSPVVAEANVTHVCIRQNSDVWIDDFLKVLQNGFDRHGISSEVFSNPYPPDHCEFIVTYTALQSWDFNPFLSHAEIALHRDGQQVAFAEYHLKGKGGLSVKKWQGTATKMDPVIDELLREY